VRGGWALRWGLAALLSTGCAAAGHGRSPLTATEHNDLGVAYFQAGKPSRAAREFERALTLSPGWPRALVNLGDARLASGDVPGAIEAYEQAVARAPEDAAAANNLAWALLRDAVRWREAEGVIRHALARHPEPRGYYLDTLGMALLQGGDVSGALEAFAAALDDPGLRSPDARALVLEHVAEAYGRTGRTAAAARCLGLAQRERERSGGAPEFSGGTAPRSIVGASPGVC
jgi:tetratricopeptide (TPR) repeat protein